MTDPHDYYDEQPLDWRESIEPDAWDIEAGISREEIIENIEEDHETGWCDPLICPICRESEVEFQ